MNRSRLFHLFGGLVLVAACLFLAWQLKGAWLRLPELSISTTFIWAVVIASVVYAGMLSLLAVAWGSLMRTLATDKHLPIGEYWRIFMRTQAPKYLPGNIFHYLGRIELLGRKGVRRTTATLSLLYESFLLMAVALLFGALGLWLTALGQEEIMGRFRLIAVACLAALILLWALQRRRARDLGGMGMPGRSWAIAIAMYALFFMMMAAILWSLAQLSGHALPMAMCLAATAVPWLLGFITPGAPGGLGVREAVMLMLLKLLLSSADGLLLVIALRLVTLFGDLWALPLSYVEARRPDGPAR